MDLLQIIKLVTSTFECSLVNEPNHLKWNPAGRGWSFEEKMTLVISCHYRYRLRNQSGSPQRACLFLVVQNLIFKLLSSFGLLLGSSIPNGKVDAAALSKRKQFVNFS